MGGLGPISIQLNKHERQEKIQQNNPGFLPQLGWRCCNGDTHSGLYKGKLSGCKNHRSHEKVCAPCCNGWPLVQWNYWAFKLNGRHTMANDKNYSRFKTGYGYFAAKFHTLGADRTARKMQKNLWLQKRRKIIFIKWRSQTNPAWEGNPADSHGGLLSGNMPLAWS